MLAVPSDVGEGDLVRLVRRPEPSNWRVREGWIFIPENRRCDADDREGITRIVIPVKRVRAHPHGVADNTEDRERPWRDRNRAASW